MADARYVIDIILNARNESARAFAEAIGEAEAFKRAMEDNERSVRESMDRLDKSTEKTAKSLTRLRSDGEKMGDSLAGEIHKADLAVQRYEKQLRKVRLEMDGLDKDSAAFKKQSDRASDLASNLGRAADKAKDLRANLKGNNEFANAIELQSVRVQKLAEQVARARANERTSAEELVVIEKKLNGEARQLVRLRGEVNTKTRELANLTEAQIGKQAQEIANNELRVHQEREIASIRERGEKFSKGIGSTDDVRAIVRMRREIDGLHTSLERLGTTGAQRKEIGGEWAAIEVRTMAERAATERRNVEKKLASEIEQIDKELERNLAAARSRGAEQAKHELKNIAEYQKASAADRLRMEQEFQRDHERGIRENAQRDKDAAKERERVEREALKAIEDADREMERQREERRRAADQAHSTYNAAVQQAAKARRFADEVGASRATEDVKQRVEFDAEQLVREAHRAHAILQATVGNLNVDADVDIARAMAKIAAFDAAMKAVKDDQNSPGEMGFWKTISTAMEDSGNRISTFDNQLRGAFTLAIGVGIQPLASAVVGLGGQFFALAASAVYAGGAVGGAMTAAAAEAAPAVGVMALAVTRLQSIFAVMKEQNLVDQQKFFRAQQQGKKLADTSDAVKNAEDSLAQAHKRVANAYEAVAEAQRKLSEARKQAVRQLEDLIMSEREAELAARGAALSQEEAQKRLREAASQGRTGDIGQARLGIDESNLGAEQAATRLSRLKADVKDAAGNPENMPQVQAAKRALDQAREQVDAANDGVERAARALEKAKRGTDAAAADSFAAAAKLEFLRGQLSSTEKDVLDTFTRIYALYQDPNGPIRGISDALLDSVGSIGKTLVGLMQREDILGPLTQLADTIGKGIESLFGNLTDEQSLNAWKSFIEGANTDIPIFVKLLNDIYDWFEKLAEAAQPLFHGLLVSIENWADGLAHSKGAQDRMANFLTLAGKHLRAWVALGAAITNLFLALAGQGGGAASGLRTVEAFTAQVRKATDYVRTHTDEVQRFFRQTERVVRAIGILIVQIGAAFLKAFDPGTVEAFADVLGTILLPALVMAFSAIGQLIKAVDDLLHIPLIGPLIKYGIQWGITGALIATILMKLRTLFAPFTAAVGFLGRRIGVIGDEASRVGAQASKVGLLTGAFGKLAGMLDGVLGKIGTLIAKLPLLKGLGTAIAGGLGGGLFGGGGKGGVDDSGIDRGPGGRVMRGVQRVFVVNWPAGGIGGGGGAGGGGPDVVGGGGGGPDEPRARGRIGRLADRVRGSRIGTRVGGGVAGTVERLGTSRVGGFIARNAGRVSRFGTPLSIAGSIGASLLADRIGGVAGGTLGGAATGAGIGATAGLIGGPLAPVTSGAGAAIGGTIGAAWGFFSSSKAQKAKKDLEEFSKSAATNLKQFRESGNAEGIKKLADEARNLGNRVPEAKDQLNKFADAADKVRTEVSKVLGPMGRMRSTFIRQQLRSDDVLDPNVVSQVLSNFQRIRKNGVESIDDLRSNLKWNVDQISKAFAEGTPSWRKAMEENFTLGITAVKRGMRDGTISATDGMKEIRRITKEQMSYTKDNMANLSDEGRKRLGDNFFRAAEAMKTQMNRGKRATKAEMDEVEAIMVKGLQAYGFTREEALRVRKGQDPTSGKSAHDTSGGYQNMTGKAEGGFVGNEGERGRDNPMYRVGNAVVGRGEAVLNWAHQKVVNSALWNQYGTTLSGLFKTVRGHHAGGPGTGFARGGYVQGAIPPGNPAARDFAERMFARGFNVTSAHDKQHAPGGYHYRDGGSAIDFGNSVNNLQKLWALLLPLRKQFAEMFGPANFRPAPSFFNGVPGAFVSGHDDHIHLGFGSRVRGALARGVNGIVGAGAQAIIPPLRLLRARQIQGGGMAGQAVESAINLAVTAANRRLREGHEEIAARGGVSSDANLAGIDAKGGVSRTLVSVWRRMGLPFKALLSAFETGIVESGLRNLAGGDADSQGWRQERASIYKDPRNVVNSAGRFYNEWRQFNDAGESAGTVAAQVQRPAAQFRGRYDEARERAMAAIRALGVDIPRNMHFDVGGAVPGKGGVPALLHGGEHVWTAAEVARAGGHQVMKALRQALGGGTQSKQPGVYAEGGQVYSADLKRKMATRHGVYDLPTVMPQEVEDVAHEITFFNRAFKTLSRKTKDYFGKVNALLRNMTDENGLLDTARAAIDRTIEATATSRIAAGRGSRTRATAGALYRLGQSVSVRGRRVTRIITQQDGVTQAELAVKDADQTLDLLRDHEDSIYAQLRRTRRNIKRINDRMRSLRKGGVSKGERKEYNDLTEDLSNARIGERDLTNRARTINKDIASAIADAAQKQADLFKAQIDAHDRGNTFRDRVLDMRDLMAGRAGNVTGPGGTIANTRERIGNLENDARYYQGKLAEAQSRGMTDVADSLAEKLDGIYKSIIEQQDALTQKAMDAVDAASQRAEQAIALRERGTAAAATLQRGGGRVRVAEGAEAANRARGAQLGTDIASYSAILGFQRGLSPDRQNQTLITQLQDKIADLQVAVQENTAQQSELTEATRDVRLSYISERSDFGTGVYGTLQNIVTSIQPEGQRNYDEERQNLEGTGSFLQRAGAGLRGELAQFGNQMGIGGLDLTGLSGQSFVDAMQGILGRTDDIFAGLTDTQRDSFTKLINQLVGNEAATTANTKELNDLNGLSNKPQGFSTTAWTKFRVAIFNGMGGLLPDYANAVPQAATGAEILRSGALIGHAGERIIPAHISRDFGNAGTKIGDINVNVTEPMEVADPQYFGKRVAWELKYANTAR